MNPLAQELAALSATEMVAALGAAQAPSLVRSGLRVPFRAASRALAETLAALDADVPGRGLPAAARRALDRFGVSLRVSGECAGEGARLVLANHPGAYDALALMSAIGRDDLLILAADRGFLRALPRLSEHFVFVGPSPSARAGALKRAVSCLRRGGAVLHFPAGQIEPDANFAPACGALLKPWEPGVAVLVRACARACGQVVVAGVRGVHSPRAKQWRLNRWAERRGVTTLSPLLQLVAGLRDVQARVHLEELGEVAGLCERDSGDQAEWLRARLIQAISTR